MAFNKGLTINPRRERDDAGHSSLPFFTPPCFGVLLCVSEDLLEIENGVIFQYLLALWFSRFIH